MGNGYIDSKIFLGVVFITSFLRVFICSFYLCIYLIFLCCL